MKMDLLKRSIRDSSVVRSLWGLWLLASGWSWLCLGVGARWGGVSWVIWHCDHLVGEERIAACFAFRCFVRQALSIFVYLPFLPLNVIGRS